MGKDLNSSNGPDTYYHITDVVISAHGATNYSMISLGSGSNLLDYDHVSSASIHVNSLDSKSIDNLHLRVCYSGYLYSNVTQCNLPIDFLSTFSGIERVYAFDCNVMVEKYDSGAYSITGPQWYEFNYVQCVYSRDNDWVGYWRIGDAYVNESYIWYDDLYFSDTVQIITVPHQYRYHYDPILERVGFDFEV